MPPRYEDVHRAFVAVCELRGAARDAALQAVCGTDLDLRREVERLLDADATGSRLGDEHLQAQRERLWAPAPPQPEQIGPFAIRGVLGAGGMGVVYRAVQDKPAREVALKLLAPGLGTPSARRRFEFEAEALGRLQHPGIAQIYAAGTYMSPFGEQPYLAMELVRGEPLDVWSARHRGDRARCVALLVALCEAVHHAHQKGLIHRDLKPSNVLVDGEGRPKVLDFGIARALEGDGANLTRTGQLVGTLAYMSPEQADGDLARVDIRSDVYALGALGYQMFTGRLPIDVADVTLSEGLRRVAHDEPPALGAHDAKLRGDLAIVLATTLRKEPERRYGSAQEFADDLRRCLAHEPVRARGTSRGYLLARFVRRHAVLLGASGAVFVALAVALAVSLRATARAELARGEAEASARDARRQADLKELVVQFLGDAFVEADPTNNPDARQEPPGQRLARVAERLAVHLQADPLTAAAVDLAVGRTLNGLADYPHARAVLLRADAAATPRGEFAMATEIAAELAYAAWKHDDFAAATAALDELDRRIARLPEAEHGLWRARAGDLRGQVLFLHGHVSEAERLWREVLQNLPADDSRAAASRANLQVSLAGVLLQRGETAPADELLARALPVFHARRGPRGMQSLATLASMAAVAFTRGDAARAVELYGQVRAAWEAVFGADHPGLIEIMQNYAAAQAKLGDVDSAVKLLEESLARGEARFGGEALGLVAPLANLGKLRWDQKRLAEAASLYERAIAIRTAKNPVADKALSGFYYDLARIRRDQGDREEHFALVRRSLALRVEALGPHHELVLGRRVEFADLLQQRGALREALTELDAVEPQVAEVLGPTHRAAIIAARLAAQVGLRLGEFDRAPARLATLRTRARGASDEQQLNALADDLQRQLEDKR